MKPQYRVVQVDGISDMESTLNRLYKEGYKLHTAAVRNSVYPFLIFELSAQVQGLKAEVIDIETRKPVPPSQSPKPQPIKK